MSVRDSWKILDVMPSGVCVIDGGMGVVFWNRTLEFWTGKKRQEILLKRLDQVYPHLASFPYRERIASIFKGGPPCLFSSQLHPYVIPSTRPDGKPRVHTTSVMSYLPDADGPVLAVIILEEVTDLVEQMKTVKDLQKKTRSAQVALSRANAKLNLLSSITRHDILNQVMGLVCYSEVLRDLAGQTPECGLYLDKVDELTRRIQKEISFTKDYEEMGVRSPVWQDVGSLAGTIGAGFATRGVGVTLPAGSVSIYADPLLEKAFYNLFENSVRHGGNVTRVEVSFHAEGETGVLVYEDNGCGIAEEEKELVFRRGFGKNTGLGLFLIREILDITGIGIRENGVPGSGVRFELRLPKGTWRTVPELP